MENLKRSRVRYHRFFNDQELVSIYSPQNSDFPKRLYTFGFITGLLGLSSLFGVLRRRVWRGLNREIMDRVRKMTMD
jgi:hypothetical protein